MVGICVYDSLEDPLESFAELHCFAGCHPDRLIIKPKEQVVHDDSRAARSLGHNPHWADAQVLDQALVFFEEPILGKDHPETFLYEVQEFVAEEVDVLDG